MDDAQPLRGSGDPARTWLGYLTNTVGGGSVRRHRHGHGSGDAHRPQRRGASRASTRTAARGTDELYTFTYPVAAAGGTYTRQRRRQRRAGRARPPGRPTTLPITIVDPLITLDGLTGTLKATGMARVDDGPAVRVRPHEPAADPRPVGGHRHAARRRLARDLRHRPARRPRLGVHRRAGELARVLRDDEADARPRATRSPGPARTARRARRATGATRHRGSPVRPAGPVPPVRAAPRARARRSARSRSRRRRSPAPPSGR